MLPNGMKASLLASIVAALLVLLASPRADAAASCSVSGYVKLEPSDQYFCDTAYGSCSGWNEVDLDNATGANAKPLSYLRVEFWNAAGTVQYGSSFTNGSGWYSKTFTIPSASLCAGQQIQFRYYFVRVHESDLNSSTPRYRFRMVVRNTSDPAASSTTWYGVLQSQSLSGSSTTLNVTVAQNYSAPASITRLANLYYTANSAITQYVTWSSNLSAKFSGTTTATDGTGILRIVYGWDPAWNTGGGYAHSDRWWIEVAHDVSPWYGAITRHELGHLVKSATHGRLDWPHGCPTYNFNGQAGYQTYGCEYGSIAMNEALATTFAVRSITGADTNVWMCKCSDASVPGYCSQLAANLTASDARRDCTGGVFEGIGDRWVTSQTQCVHLTTTDGCPCTTSPPGSSSCDATANTTMGWRNILQVERFLWDALDSNAETGDNTDINIYDLISYMESMSGTPSADGSYNEPDDSPCDPVTDGAWVSPALGTRDAYNIWDFADMIPGTQTDLRALNCVSGATD